MKIYKYTLAITDVQRIPLPQASEVLTIQMQDGSPQLWALVNPSFPKSARRIFCFGRGNQFPRELILTYIATVQDGPFVWHFFIE